MVGMTEKNQDSSFHFHSNTPRLAPCCVLQQICVNLWCRDLHVAHHRPADKAVLDRKLWAVEAGVGVGGSSGAMVSVHAAERAGERPVGGARSKARHAGSAQ
jgi:hypothetical protein